MTNQIKAIDWYFLMVLFIYNDIRISSNFRVCRWNRSCLNVNNTFLFCCMNKLYNVLLTFLFMYGIMKCDHSIESYKLVPWCDAIYDTVHATDLVQDFVHNLLNPCVALKCGHSTESYRAVLFCGAVYYAVQGGSYF